MNKKKIIIYTGIALIILVVALAVIFLPRKEAEPSNPGENTKAPVLMTTDEKQSLGLQPETKVEVLGRDEQGEVSSYRILRDEQGYPIK